LKWLFNNFNYKMVNCKNSTITSVISFFLAKISSYAVFVAISQKQIYQQQQKH